MILAELQVNYNGFADYSWNGYYNVGYTTFYDPIANTTTVTLSESVRHRYSGAYNYYTSAMLDITVRADDSGDSGTAHGSYESTTNGGMDNYYSYPSPRVITVQHASTAGVKTVTVSASSRLQVYIATDDYSTTDGYGSVSVAVGEYYPASGLTVSNGTLGVSQNLTVDRIVDSFTHTITYACGTDTGPICTKSSNTSINWTPPIALASQNTKGTSVAVQFTITTYTGDTVLGTKTVSITCAIPESVKPSFTVAVSDAMGYANNFGGYVQTKSKLNIVVDITTMYEATVASVKVIANGETHNTSNVTTGALKNSGNNTITVEVIDSRGRKVSGNTTVAVLAYSAPAISLLTYNRCDSDGTDNVLGNYAEITFSNAVTSLSGKNAVSYTLEYKKTSDSEYSTVDMSDFAGVYSVTNGKKIFSADAGSSFDVRLTVADSFDSADATLLVDTGSAIMHWLPRGVGMAIGKIAEKLHTLELGWKIHMNGNRIEGLGDPSSGTDAANKNYVDKIDWFNTGTNIPNGSDLDTYKTPGKYYVSSTTASNTIINSPVVSDNFVLFVFTRTSGNSLAQMIITLNSVVYFRGSSSNGVYREWRKMLSDISLNSINSDIADVAKKATPINLLDNSDFANLIAQAGFLGNHGATVYFADRWKTGGASPSYDETSRIITFSSDGSSMIRQKVAGSISGKTVTLAIKASNVSGSVKLSESGAQSGHADVAIQNGITTHTFVAEDNMYALVWSSDAGSLCIDWMALYEGEYTAETLPEYRPKGYGLELLECQRYYQIRTANNIANRDMRPMMRLDTFTKTALETGGYSYSADL